MNDKILESLDVMSTSIHYNRWIYNNIKQYLSDNILDIGSGIGNIVKYFNSGRVKKIILSDKSEEMLEYLNNTFDHSVDHSIIKMDICDENYACALPSIGIDVITCINVLEHIKDDTLALTNMHKVLKEKGKLLLIVPAFSFLYGTGDAMIGHYRRYTKGTLNKKLAKINFVIQKQYYMNFFGVITWFLSGRVLRQKHFNRNSCKILDKFVPFLEKLEKHHKPFIGQSLVTVCCKP